MENNSNQLSNWSRGQLLIDNVQSGCDSVDKAVEMLVKACIAELWDESTQSWIDNKCSGNGLYIEANKYLLYEISFDFIEFVSKVPRHKIIANQYDSIEEKARVDKATQLCNDSIFFANDFYLALTTLENTIKNAKEHYDIQYVVVDNLITGNPNVDIISYLKKVAKQYNIGIYIAIQKSSVD